MTFQFTPGLCRSQLSRQAAAAKGHGLGASVHLAVRSGRQLASASRNVRVKSMLDHDDSLANGMQCVRDVNIKSEQHGEEWLTPANVTLHLHLCNPATANVASSMHRIS
jgi:hypothetical protein